MVRNAGIGDMPQGPESGVEAERGAGSETRGDPSGAPSRDRSGGGTGSTARASLAAAPASGRAGGRRTQAERVAESDRKMLEASLVLIGEHGYRGTTLAAIGRLSGYSRGLVNERFGSKEGLLWALVTRILRVWRKESAAAGNDGKEGFEALDAILDNHLRAVREDRGIRALYQLMFEALGPTPTLLQEFRDLHRQFRENEADVIRRGVERGTFRADADPNAQAALLVAAQRGIAFQWMLDPNGFDLERAYDELKRNLRRALAPEIAQDLPRERGHSASSAP